MQRTEPDARPLGVLALGAGILSVLLSWTYFFSLHSFLAAAVAIALGLPSRSHERSRGLGNAALVLAAAACVVANATLILL